MKINRKLIIITTAAVLSGFLLGWLIFGGSGRKATDEHQHETEIAGEMIWTCSMHPQIRQNEPGDCPICGMDLIPLVADKDEDLDPEAIRMSSVAMQLANISTAVAGSMDPVKSVRLTGKIQPDERLVFSQSSHIPGRIEKLTVNFTGEYVSKGDVIASVYSPELVTAQEELFEARKIAETQPQLYNAAMEKLRNWKLSENQIEEILQSGTSKETFDIQADVSGYIMQRKVNTGDYIGKGKVIYEIADLSRVWVIFDVYESDIQWIKRGDEVRFIIASHPGESFRGRITFLDPVIDPVKRTARARVEANNSSLKLKPEMFVSGTVSARLTGKSDNIVVPRSAVMWTGKRSVVYVKSTTEGGVNFVMREVTIGPSLGDSYIIESGLQAGEEIAVSGTFSIDAAAQLAGKPSMMSPEGGPAITGHDHGGATMSGTAADMDQTGSGVIVMTQKPVNISSEFKSQMTGVYDAYLKIKDAFIASDAKIAGEEAIKARNAIEAVDMGLLEGDAHNKWMQQLKTLRQSINSIAGSSDIEVQRTAFSDLSNNLYTAIKTFGLADKTVFYQFCPMAFDNKGAYWLSETETIRNPYFGDAMLKCGETKETLTF
ncbi:MAG: efflux RND transporter periplasmic adaptor subunit [Bacteroidales bacterium]|nr:efflux RND transporter periplasmic adaptor subunit [Bacteroidales bacterium]